MTTNQSFWKMFISCCLSDGKEELGSGASKIHASPVRFSRYMECEMVASRSPARADRQFRGIVKLRPTTVFDAQHGGFTAGSSPVSWLSSQLE